MQMCIWFQQGTRCWCRATNIRHEWHCSLSPSLIADNLSLYHHLPPLIALISNSFCLFTQWQPPYASCCTVLLYFSRHCTVRLKNVFFTLGICFLHIICVKGKYYKLITVQYYTDSCVSWVLGLIGTHLMNVLLVQNLFICSGLTVIKKK